MLYHVNERNTDVNKYEEMIPYLLHWYRFHARVLPWREDPSAYHVWVSEIMLQQTRVEAVRSYYHRFLSELPDIAALAACPEDRLLKLWEGLGYYSRVRNMKRCAQVVCEEYDGRLPEEAALLRKLPGIGSYTAGAIASIAFRKPEPAVDGNFLRVLSRITGSREDISDATVKRRMEDELRAVMPGEESGALNQAIMDLGAMICIPNGAPHCEECPLVHMCEAFREGLTGEIPKKAAKKARRIEERTVLIVRSGDRILLRKRPEKGLLAGLWEYPNEDGTLHATEAEELLTRLIPGICIEGTRKLKAAKHIFTHIEWHMTAYEISVKENPELTLPAGYHFAGSVERVEGYSLPSAYDKWKLS